MTERREPHYEETEHPRNPPNAVLNRGARNAALRSYLGPIIILFIIVGLALLFWVRRAPGRDADDNTLNPATGTTGEQLKDNNPARDLSQGGGDPAPKPDSTSDELKDRGDTR
jgi:hypothetical protein